MSSYLDKAKAARSDYTVRLIEFQKEFKKNPSALYCFFEGEDSKYYSVRIQGILVGVAWEPIRCRGKKDVLSVCKALKLNPDYSAAKLAYFIDRDFDAPFEHELGSRVYEGPVYSVENFYVKPIVVRRFLQAEVNFKDGDSPSEGVDAILAKYDSVRAHFNESILLLNAWLKVQRSKEAELGTTRLNIRGYDVEHFVDITLDGCAPKKTLDDLAGMFPHAHPVSVDEIEVAKQWLITNDCDYVCRGKFHLGFVRKFLAHITLLLRRDGGGFCRQPATVSCTLSKENCLSELSQYAETPSCLSSFLARVSA